MSIYRPEDERAIRAQRLVEDWARSGLLTQAQRDQVMPGLAVDVRRTNRFLRATLFVFTLMIVWAFAGLVAVFLDLGGPLPTWLSLIGAAASFWGAQAVVRRYRFYRFGVEEGLAVAAAGFFVVFAATVVSSPLATLVAFSAASVAAAILFARFGFLYAGVAAVVCAPLVIFDLEQSDTRRRIVACAVMLTCALVARARRRNHDPEHPADSYAVVAAVAWAAMYAIANLKISDWVSAPDDDAASYWGTYAVMWLVPVAGLWLAIRDRDRAMLDVNIVLALATLLSNKPYLGAESKPWDPILFGVFLIVMAIGLRRWLSAGEGGSRRGFVATRILASERDRLSMAGHASLVVSAAAPAQSYADQGPTVGGGGRSGGAGASGQY